MRIFQKSRRHNIVENGEDLGLSIEGERGIPSVSRRRGSAAMRWGGTIVVLALAIAVLIFINTRHGEKDQPNQRKTSDGTPERIENRLPPLDFSALSPKKPLSDVAPPNLDRGKPPIIPGGGTSHAINVPPITEANVGLPPISPVGSGSTPNGKKILSPEEQWRQRRTAGNLVVYEGNADVAHQSANTASESNSTSGPFLGPQMGNQGDELSSKLKTVSTPEARAMTLTDRNFLLAKGSTIGCTLETKLDSTVPGMVRCVAQQDVYSDNGRILLLERGTIFTGVQQGNMKQGQARIFVLWERAKTPKGVVVTLASPGADPLGGSGLDGHVDTHFWDRFGGAIMLSVLQDATAKAAGTNVVQIGQATVTAGRDTVAEALRNSINIPPTLYKNHGQSIMIYVARDLDFRTVYSLENVSNDGSRDSALNQKQ